MFDLDWQADQGRLQRAWQGLRCQHTQVGLEGARGVFGIQKTGEHTGRLEQHHVLRGMQALFIKTEVQ